MNIPMDLGGEKIKEKEFDRLKKALPKGFRFKWRPADLEGPAEVVINFPDYYLLQVVDGRRFFGLLKNWKTIGYIEEYFPFPPESKLFLHERFADEYEDQVKEFVKKAGLKEKMKVVIKGPPTWY